jgi:hypothetical protein
MFLLASAVVPRSFNRPWGITLMLYRTRSLATTLLSLALLSSGGAYAADLPVKAAAPVAEAPFFFVNDNRLTYAYEFTGSYPGLSNQTVAQTVAFTHFDAWAYGTNLINLQLIKYDHATPASPCPIFQRTGACAGATEFYGLIRSTFGFNQIFNTNAFSIGPLRNISFEVGADGEVMNTFLAPAKKDLVAGLQFAFDLPYKGFFNVAPLLYKEWNHNAFLTPSFVAAAGGPGIVDGNLDYRPTWVFFLRRSSSSPSAAAPAGMVRKARAHRLLSFRSRPSRRRPSNSTANPSD